MRALMSEGNTKDLRGSYKAFQSELKACTGGAVSHSVVTLNQIFL